MASIQVLDAAGATQTVTYPDAGRAAAAASSPMALSTEDKASLDAVGTKLDTLQATVNGTDPQLPATLGPKTSANSLSMTLASDQALPLPAGAATQATLANIDADVGAVADAAAGSDTGSFSLIALVKRALQNWTTLLGRVPAQGQGAMASSLPVVVASDQSNVPARLNAYNYPISTLNSSTTQLAAGASFTGGIESAQDQPSLSILLTSDQPMTVTVRQFIDVAGTFAAPDIVFYVRAGQGFARSLTVNGNFVRVIAQNTGAATTTTFNLNCAFGALGDSDSTGVMPVTELPLVLTGAAAQTATVNNILEPVAGANGTAVSGYRSASVQVVSTGTGGTFIFEQSNDGTNWAALPVFNAALVTGVPITAAITATASAIIYTFPVRANFLRLRIASTITGGSIQAVSRLSTEPWTAAAQLVASNAAANLLAQVSGSVTATGVAGPAAHDAAVSGNPVRLAGRAITANYTAVASGDVADLVTTLVGALIQKPYAIPESDWTYAAAAGGIVNTTDVAAKAAAAAGIRNYVTAAQLRNASAVATEFVIKDGASTVLWRGQLPANMTGDLSVHFPTPLRGSAATAVNVACLTTGAAVYANLQGYIAP